MKSEGKLETRGRKAHEKTTESAAEVAALAAFGVNQEEIAVYIGVSVPTLHKYYRSDLDQGAAKGRIAVTKFLFHSASGKSLDDGASYSDCLRAAMFYAKTRMGWKETNVTDVTSSDGTIDPVKIEIVAASRRIDDDTSN